MQTRPIARERTPNSPLRLARLEVLDARRMINWSAASPYQRSPEKPSSASSMATSTREWTPSFSKMCRTWTFAVDSLMKREAAICRLLRPCATSSQTSLSLFESVPVCLTSRGILSPQRRPRVTSRDAAKSVVSLLATDSLVAHALTSGVYARAATTNTSRHPVSMTVSTARTAVVLALGSFLPKATIARPSLEVVAAST